MTRRYGHRLCTALAMAGLLSMSACGDTPAPVAVAAPPSAPAAVAAQAANAASAPSRLGNDPSAPADTPLCGLAGHERAALAQSLLPRQVAEAGQCTSYACYDAATATYIGADGYRHVCR